jgi:hypothetical protein
MYLHLRKKIGCEQGQKKEPRSYDINNNNNKNVMILLMIPIYKKKVIINSGWFGQNRLKLILDGFAQTVMTQTVWN